MKLFHIASNVNQTRNSNILLHDQIEEILFSCNDDFPLHSEIHHNKKIKFLRSDRGGEYLSYEFGLHFKQCGIFSQLTPPGTPQRNGVSERHNRTLFHMVRSMMSLTDLPISFWGCFHIKIGHHLNPLRRHHMNYGLSRNLSCHFLKIGVAMLM